MKRLLMQSDDFGITEAACEGAIKGISQGIIRNSGIFINMKHASSCIQKAKALDFCLGIDINVVAGNPVSDPKSIPHLVDQDGKFKTSKVQIQTHPVKSAKNLIIEFEEDPYPYEEVRLECENQVKRFIELAGKKPGYLHGHSLCTPNLYQAMKEMAQKYEIPFSFDILTSEKYHYLLPSGEAFLNKNKTLEAQISLTKKENFLNTFLPNIKEDETWIYITHCGYVDYHLFQQSSLTLERMMDVDLATDPAVLAYIKENNIELITYQDLAE